MKVSRQKDSINISNYYLFIKNYADVDIEFCCSLCTKLRSGCGPMRAQCVGLTNEERAGRGGDTSAGTSGGLLSRVPAVGGSRPTRYRETE